MEAPEVPLEEVHEHIQHHASGHDHGHGHGSRPGMPAPERWTMGVALSTALFAALAAIASLIAGGQANEAMAAQIRSSDRWNEYQASRIKAHLLDNKIAVLAALGHAANAEDKSDQDKYRSKKGELQDMAERMERESEAHLLRHETMATAVTLFQVAIAMGAIAVLTRKRMFWTISLTLGALGLLSFGRGVLSIAHGDDATAPPHEHATGAAAPGSGPLESGRPADEVHAAPPASSGEPAHPAAAPAH